jgi:hypothetical protein
MPETPQNPAESEQSGNLSYEGQLYTDMLDRTETGMLEGAKRAFAKRAGANDKKLFDRVKAAKERKATSSRKDPEDSSEESPGRESS